MNNIYLIVGPSGSGKTTLASNLERYFGFKEVISYTTRPKRSEDEHGHIFVTKEEFDALGEKCAYTKFYNYEYCVTVQQINESDIFVVDPEGIDYMREHYHGPKGIKVIALYVDKYEAYKRMRARGDSHIFATERGKHDEVAFANYLDKANAMFPTVIKPLKLAHAVASYIQECEDGEER